VSSSIWRVGLGIVLVTLALLVILSSACISSVKSAGNQTPLISSIEAKYLYVDPLGNTEIQCVASDPKGGKVSFKWTCTGGRFIGEGPTVTWEAPKDYGDYHIMVIATDSKGSSTNATLTISVVTRPAPKRCCGQ